MAPRWIKRKRSKELMKKSMERVERSKLWGKFRERARGTLIATTIADVALNSGLVGVMAFNYKAGIGGLYAYAFVKDFLIRPLQGLCSIELRLKEVKAYVATYYLLNIATLFTYPILPIETYISAAMNLISLSKSRTLKGKKKA